MVTTPQRPLFREKALEKATSPERLDQAIQIIQPYHWLPLAALGSLVVAGLTWSVVGRIPITANGQGVLTYPSTVVDFQSSGSGQLLETVLLHYYWNAEAGKTGMANGGFMKSGNEP